MVLNLKNGRRKSMLNREDVRKVLEARATIVNRLKDEGKHLDDVSMKDLFEFILGEIKKQEDLNRPKG